MPSGKFAQSLIGERFGRLEVIDRAPNYTSKNGSEAVWVCRCSCGQVISVRAGQLRSGHTKSCGCLQKEAAIKAHTRHSGSGTKLYGVWSSMIRRCENKSDRRYSDWGGRGIAVCAEWHDFIPFRDWAISHGYAEGLTIDRINNDGNYEPANCRWATYKEQAANKRPVKRRTLQCQ